MPTLMDRLKAEAEKLNREQEDSHGDNTGEKSMPWHKTPTQYIMKTFFADCNHWVHV
jgi:hypothetical protein